METLRLINGLFQFCMVMYGGYALGKYVIAPRWLKFRWEEVALDEGQK